MMDGLCQYSHREQLGWGGYWYWGEALAFR